MATVAVPQQDGEIRLSVAGDTAVAYSVSKGKVTVPEGAELQNFLLSVVGSSVVGGSVVVEDNFSPVDDSKGKATPVAS